MCPASEAATKPMSSGVCELPGSFQQLPSGPGAVRNWGGPWPVPQPAPGAGGRAVLGRGAGEILWEITFFLLRSSFQYFFFSLEGSGRMDRFGKGSSAPPGGGSPWR